MNGKGFLRVPNESMPRLLSMAILFFLSVPAACAAAPDNSPECQSYLEFTSALEQLRAGYTDGHPDVIRLTDMIHELERSIITENPGIPVNELCIAASRTVPKPEAAFIESEQEIPAIRWLLVMTFTIDGESSYLMVSDYSSLEGCRLVGQALTDKFVQAGQQASLLCQSDQQISEQLEQLIN